MPTSLHSETVQMENMVWSRSQADGDAASGFVRQPASLPAGDAGSSVNGGASSVITLGTGHGITDADIVGVGWAAGKRVGMTVSAYDGTTITVTNSTGHGDSYVAGTADVVVSKAVDIPTIAFDGDDMLAFLCYSTAGRAAVDFLDTGGASLYISELVDANDGDYWSDASGDAHPITGNAVTDAKAYNLSEVATVINVGVILDNS